MIPAALTIKSNGGRLRQLVSTVEVIIPNTKLNKAYEAIWDTGATGSVITTNVVSDLGLVATGMSIVNTAGGTRQQNTYEVDISLNNGVIIRGVTVTCADALSGGSEVLIGMDIISQGDFSITNLNGNTCMSFRVPSMHEIDFCAHPTMKANSNPNRGSNSTPPKRKRKKK